MKKYFSYHVKKEVTVQNLVTIETLDISPGFSYPEESHAFYELAYIDSGSILCHSDYGTTTLQQGDFLLIPPQLSHAYSAAYEQSAIVFIICFYSRSEYLSILDQKIPLDKENKRIVFEIIKEAKNCFAKICLFLQWRRS